MQALFSAIIMGEDFMGEQFSKQTLQARQWRTSVAHDYKHLEDQERKNSS